MPLALRVSGGWMSGSGVGASACERTRDRGIDGSGEYGSSDTAAPFTVHREFRDLVAKRYCRESIVTA